MKWELGRLAHCANEDQESCPERVLAQHAFFAMNDDVDDVVEPERADRDRHDDRAEEEPCVRDLVDHERLVACIDIRKVFPVVGDEQVGRNTNEFPADDELDEVRCGNKHEHAASKQGE